MKLLLIDGNSVLFRGFYATYYGNIMKTSKGVYTNAVYAFANMLNKAIKTIQPDYCAVAFDKGKHTFRHDFAPDYKAGRRETPEELVGQFQLVREMLEAYQIPYFEFDTIEADEVDLESTRARIVRGVNIRIGKGCEIDRIEYSGTIEHEPSAVIREIVQIN